MRWDKKDEKSLKQLLKSGHDMKYIAGVLHRSVDSITGKITRMGLARPEPAGKKPEEDSRIKELEDKIKAQAKQLKKGLENYSQTPIDDFLGDTFRGIATADWHAGSICDRHDLIRIMREYAKRQEIRHIFHGGDITDGYNVFRGQQFEQDSVGADAQLDHLFQLWPDDDDLTMHLIAGNHDTSFIKKMGYNITRAFSDGRKNVKYYGEDQGAIKVDVCGTPLNIALWHPDGGTSYALSHKPQKLIEAISGGEKPHVLILGHYHKAFFMPEYRNVACIQAGTLCSQTPFMRRRGLAAHLGFWEFGLQANGTGLAGVYAKFIPFYEAW